MIARRPLPPRLPCRLGLWAAAGWLLAACAQGGEATGPPLAPGAQRMIVTTVVEWPSAAEVASRVERLAGVPVRSAMLDTPRNYVMILDCPDDASCRDAIARVAAVRTFVQSIVPDARQRIPRKPDREAAR
ncbi:MAG: hypothetical protein U1E89_08480 [Burkholderiaceae bacterium]